MNKCSIIVIVFLIISFLILGFSGESSCDEMKIIYPKRKKAKDLKNDYSTEDFKNAEVIKQDVKNSPKKVETIENKFTLSIKSPENHKTYACNETDGKFLRAKITLEYTKVVSGGGNTVPPGKQNGEKKKVKGKVSGSEPVWKISSFQVLGYNFKVSKRIKGNKQIIKLLPGEYTIKLYLVKGKKETLQGVLRITTVGLRIVDPIKEKFPLPNHYYGNAKKSAMAVGIVVDGPIDDTIANNAESKIDSLELGSAIFKFKKANLKYLKREKKTKIKLNKRCILTIPNSFFSTVIKKTKENVKIEIMLEITYDTKVMLKKKLNLPIYYDPRIEVVQFGINEEFYSSSLFDEKKRSTSQIGHTSKGDIFIKNTKREYGKEGVVIGDGKVYKQGKNHFLWAYCKYFPVYRKGLKDVPWQIDDWPSSGSGTRRYPGNKLVV